MLSHSASSGSRQTGLPARLCSAPHAGAFLQKCRDQRHIFVSSNPTGSSSPPVATSRADFAIKFAIEASGNLFLETRRVCHHASAMNTPIPIIMGAFGGVTAVATAFANANGMFAGHPHAAYWLYGAAAILVILAIVFWMRTSKTPNTSHTAQIKEGFNPSQNVTANPTIIIHPQQPVREAILPPPVISRESNLVLCRVWKESLYRVGDEFCFRVSPGLESSFQRWMVMLAEIRNATRDSAIGAAKNVTAEFVFRFEGRQEMFGPLVWAERNNSRATIEVADTACVILAAYLLAPFTKMSEWRIPVNTRQRPDELLGANKIFLKEWRETNQGIVSLNIVHPESGKVVRTFQGTYQWTAGTQDPVFEFSGKAHDDQPTTIKIRQNNT